jgi:hypothetical protein
MNINLFLIIVLVGISVMYIYTPKSEIIIKCPTEHKNKKCF